jgi:tetratricopeptide (TPR) repeat protein
LQYSKFGRCGRFSANGMFKLRNPSVVVVFACLFSPLLWPQDADALFRRGGLFFTDGKLDAAIAAFRGSLALRPGYAPAWKALGVVYASRGDFENAETPFRNACERQPSLPDACLYYGRTLYLLNRFQPAIDTLRRTIRKNGETGEAYRLLALSLEALGQAAEAGDAFRQAVRLNRGSAPEEDPGIDYAVFLFRQGRAEDAIDPLQSVLKRHPDAARAHLEMGCIQLALDHLPEAAAHLEQALALDPRAPRAHLLLGKVYLRQGKPQAAEEHLRLGSQAGR